MYLKEEQLGKFKGAETLNAAGEDLKTFLEKYDPTKYQNPSSTVDTLVFTYQPGNNRKISRVLMIKRGNHPSIGWWALPGGFVEYRENINQAALRELQEETGIEDIQIEQLKSYGDYDRDPRTRIITTAYVALVPEGSVKAQAADDASDSGWFEISDECIEEFTKPSEVEGVQLKHEIHRLVLTEPVRNIVADAVIEITSRIDSILENKTYQVKETNLVAADHGAIILEGYHYLMNRLNRQ